MISKVSTDKAPAAIGPYSQGVVANGFVFTSGQIAIDPATGSVVSGGVKEQTEQVMKNLGAVLEAAGASFESAVKVTCFLSDMSYFAEFNEVYARYFVGSPARSCVAVRGLPRDFLVEVEVVANI